MIQANTKTHRTLNLNKHKKTKSKTQPTWQIYELFTRVCVSLCTTVVHNTAQSNLRSS